MDAPVTSPIIRKPGIVIMDFPDAIREIMAGGRVTRREWANDQIFGELHQGVLSLHKADGKYYSWMVADGDMMAIDWYSLTDIN